MPDPVALVPTIPDAELAEELRREVLAVHEPLLAVLNRARTLGFLINVSVGAAGPHAPIAIQQLQIMKQF